MPKFVWKRALGTIVAASALVAIQASPASAATTTQCNTTQGAQGAYGILTLSWNVSRTKINNLTLRGEDKAADGMHPAVRLVTEQGDYDYHYWSWHHVNGGSGTAQEWKTSASDSEGIRSARIQVANFDGSRLVYHCLSQSVFNPAY